MKYLLCFCAILILASGSAEDHHSSHNDHSSKVLKLTKDNYQASKLNSESIVVLWHGPDR